MTYYAPPEARLAAMSADEKAREQDLVQALEQLERASDVIASLRSHEMYLAMIDAGQQVALEALDAARRKAREILARRV